MSLPVPIDQALIPIRQFYQNQPPFMPNIQVLPPISNSLVDIAVLVANEAGSKAHLNNLSMFCYNILSNNMWQNNDYVELVKLAADLCCVKTYEGIYTYPEAGIQQSVSEALALYKSVLLFRYNELRSYVTQQLIDNASQNVAVYNELLNKIRALYSGQNPLYGGGAPNFQPTPMSHYGQTPQYMPPVSDFRSNPGMQQRGTIPFNPNMSGGGSVSRYGPSSKPTESFSTSVNRGEHYINPVRQDRYFDKTEPFKPVEQINEQIIVEDTIDYVTTLGGREMDRAGQNITYFGDVYNSSAVVKDGALNRSINSLSSANASSDLPSSSDYVYPTCMLEPSTENALLSGRIKHLEQMGKNPDIKAFRCFSIICNPLISNTDLNGYIDIIRKNKNLVGISNKLKSLTVSMSSSENNLPAKDVSDALDVFTEIDNKLTIIINDFLKYNINTSIKIGSFVEDVAMLYNYINSKYGLKYAEAYSIFESELICSLSQEFVGNTLTEIKESLGIPESIYVGILPYDISTTYLNINSKELGLNVEDKPLVVIQEVTPSIHEVFVSLKKHLIEAELNTICNYLVLSDGVIYRMHYDYVDNERFMLVKK